jgi:hypothetical protein
VLGANYDESEYEVLVKRCYEVSLSEPKKNFFEIGRKGYQKKRNFALISKM